MKWEAVDTSKTEAEYYLVERPFLRLTSRFRAPRTAPFPDAIAPAYPDSAQ